MAQYGFVSLVAMLVALAGAGQAQAQAKEDSIVTLLAPGEAAAPDGAALAAAGQVAAAMEDGAADAPAPATLCGDQVITIAKMPWPSAAILAEIHARLLTGQFGCKVKIVPGDLAATGSSMGATGQPAVAPEMWISRVPDIWNAAVKAQQVRQAGVSYAEPQFEGWFVPDYVVAAHPELKDMAGLKADAWVFAHGGARARFISCPPDWACAVVNRNLLRANGLDSLFTVEEPANRFELDTLIAEAVSRKEPVVFYYWQPNAVLAQFGFKSLDLGPFDKDAFACAGRIACATPAPTSFAPDPVVIALADWVYVEAPEIAAYFQRAHMPLQEMDTLLQDLNQTGATAETVADGFVAARGEVWQQWVGRPPPP